jgi:hypothetical protein
MTGGWRDWALDSPGAIRLSRAARVVAGLGVAIGAAVVLANLVRGRAVPGVVVLLIPAVPAVFVGQLWAIAILVARHDRSSGSDGRPSRWRMTTNPDPRRFFFQGLPLWQANTLLVIFFLAWVTGMTAFRSLISGSPTSPTPACPYRLVDHGTYSCVSRSKYLAAGAAGQRLAAGVLAGFFAIHFGVAAAELRRRRGSSVRM